jgi:hypothetical protein
MFLASIYYLPIADGYPYKFTFKLGIKFLKPLTSLNAQPFNLTAYLKPLGKGGSININK